MGRIKPAKSTRACIPRYRDFDHLLKPEMVRIARRRLRTDGYLSGRDFADLVELFGEEPLPPDLRKRLVLFLRMPKRPRRGNPARRLFEDAVIELARAYHNKVAMRVESRPGVAERLQKWECVAEADWWQGMARGRAIRMTQRRFKNYPLPNGRQLTNEFARRKRN
jgi:hypothetical protein